MENLIVLPFQLGVAYAALILSAGAGLGIVFGRRLGMRSIGRSISIERRVSVLEGELDVAQGELKTLSDENAFLRDLAAPKKLETVD